MAEGKGGCAPLLLLVRHVPEMECGKVWTPAHKGTRHCLRTVNIRYFEEKGRGVYEAMEEISYIKEKIQQGKSSF